ncbi:hypothetical protein KI387_023277, partial [Taxus chinensis]
VPLDQFCLKLLFGNFVFSSTLLGMPVQGLYTDMYRTSYIIHVRYVGGMPNSTQ